MIEVFAFIIASQGLRTEFAFTYPAPTTNDQANQETETVVEQSLSGNVRIDVGTRITIIYTSKSWLFIDPPGKRCLEVEQNGRKEPDSVSWKLATDIAPVWPGFIAGEPDRKHFEARLKEYKENAKLLGFEDKDVDTDQPLVHMRSISYGDIWNPSGRVEWWLGEAPGRPETLRTVAWLYHSGDSTRTMICTNDNVVVKPDSATFSAPKGYQLLKAQESDLGTFLPAGVSMDLVSSNLRPKTEGVKEWRIWLESMAAYKRTGESHLRSEHK